MSSLTLVFSLMKEIKFQPASSYLRCLQKAPRSSDVSLLRTNLTSLTHRRTSFAALNSNVPANILFTSEVTGCDFLIPQLHRAALLAGIRTALLCMSVTSVTPFKETFSSHAFKQERILSTLPQLCCRAPAACAFHQNLNENLLYLNLFVSIPLLRGLASVKKQLRGSLHSSAQNSGE